MNEFLQRAEAAIQNRRLLARGQKMLVAVSGGVDSMVLLHAQDSLAKKYRWKIFVAHFNHQLRGRASDADEKLVRKISGVLKRPIIVDRADVKKFAAQSKLSIEMAARKLRHEFLARTAKRFKIQIVALAHHADDQVELFFLRLLRGAGGEGLAGMKWRSPSPANKMITLVRPLLDFTKVELLQFAREHKIRFRDDASNASSNFLRNRIRNELLPLLRENYQPGVDKIILRLMEIVGAESEFAGDAARQWLENSRRRRGDESQTKIGNRQSAIGNKSEPPDVVSYGFEKLPVAVQRKIMQRQLAGLGVAADFEVIEQLRAAPGKRVNVSSGLSVSSAVPGWVKLHLPATVEFNADELVVDLAGRAGRVEFGGHKFTWALKSFDGLRGRSPHQSQKEFFDADKIGGQIILRHWRPGDRFQPIGLRSATKLQDLFVNAKIPAARRRELILAATAAGEIFWVEGLRIGERFKLTVETRRSFYWNWSK